MHQNRLLRRVLHVTKRKDSVFPLRAGWDLSGKLVLSEAAAFGRKTVLLQGKEQRLVHRRAKRIGMIRKQDISSVQ